ncbi:MAG: hypothetical protein KDB23_20940 [Planctomycetales bacterium]|nr:hypothetical protein [Planctomycetales bacterium]
MLHITYADDDLPEPPHEQPFDIKAADDDPDSSSRIRTPPSQMTEKLAEPGNAT